MTTQRTYWNTAALFTLAVASTGVTQEHIKDKVAGDNSWIGVITKKDTVVRCGANESYYPVQIANSGDLVRVIGKKQNWYQVQTDGTVFDNTVGFIKYPESNSSVFLVEGKRGTAQGDLEIIAKNLDSEELYRSWRPVFRLSDSDQVDIVDTVRTEPGTLHREAYIVHTVDIPSSATVWIDASFIDRATDTQALLFNNEGGNKAKDSSASSSTNTVGETDTTTIETGLAEPELEPVSLVGVEAAWAKITKEPVMNAEISPLYDLYSQLLMENADDLVIGRIAVERMKQLNVWKGLRDQKIRIEKLHQNLNDESKAIGDFQLVMKTYSDYVIVGRITLSNTFDGKLRPMMYRIQNSWGRTVGYLPTQENIDFGQLVGQVVGINGSSSWNPTWRVRVIEPTGFDLLAPTTAEVPSDIQ
ncbi:MAG: hypothetical protein QGF07_05145 [Phycisphaerales bacterium]|nr:hypothetical protein [Phycisphaerales bacterium]